MGRISHRELLKLWNRSPTEPRPAVRLLGRRKADPLLRCAQAVIDAWETSTLVPIPGCPSQRLAQAIRNLDKAIKKEKETK